MRSNVIIILLFNAFFLTGLNGNAQNSLWEKTTVDKLKDKTLSERSSELTAFDLYTLHTYDFKKKLQSAPSRYSHTSEVVMNLPVGNGEMQSFKVFSAPVMAPLLQAKYPSIQSYVAQGLDNPTAIARISVSNLGVHAMISSGNFPTIYIDPYTKDKKSYTVYTTNSILTREEVFQCFVEGSDKDVRELALNDAYGADDGVLRTYRLALASTRQYANFHLNRQQIPTSATEYEKKEAVLSEMNVAMTRINGVFERDLSVTMELVENNDEIIFLDAASDPYTNNDAFEMLGENRTTLNTVIGVSNYDIGHVFSTGGGGVAYLGSVCTAYKAGGVTGLNSPIADPFYIDYVSHEMGHQFGANHTFNGSAGSCSGGNRNFPTAVEPGSASTIMGYAGICAPQNVQIGSDSYFHTVSIQEMWLNITGSTSCAIETNISNQAPVVDAGANYTIPKSTPFILDGTATDPDGDVVTYVWEQMDNQIAQQPPVNSSVQGPLFRSIEPTEESHRYFPKLETVLAGSTQNTWEVVPSVARTMEFMLTVRDNRAGGGATARDGMTVIVNDGAGPFEITSQNTATIWGANSEEAITWDVANTDSAPINCTEVDILLSLDGGYTYPISLAQNIPNTGSAIITVPDEELTTARIKIKASDNIFFDVNNSNITITRSMGVTDYATNDFVMYPNPSDGNLHIEFSPETMDVVEVLLYDINGKRIKQQVYNDISALLKLDLDYQEVKSGVYFVVIKNGDKTATKQWVRR